MFKQPENLLLLLGGLIWIALLWRASAQELRRKRRALASEVMLDRIVGHTPTKRPFWKGLMMVLAFALIGLALARPLGGLMEEDVTGSGLDLIVALDVSTSMNARDIGGNSRLDVAKALLVRMMNGFLQDRVGLVIFAGDTMVQCPLSHDRNAFLTFLERVDPSLLTKQGTNLAGAIETALDRFDYTASQSRVVMLISDGEDSNRERLEKAIAAARERNVLIYTLGIGSREGAPIPVGRDVWGRFTYKVHQGRRVVTKLEDGTLRKIAEGTAAKYFRTSDIASARAVAEELTGLKRVAISQGKRFVVQELFFWPCLAAFFVLFLEWLMSDRIPYERERDHWLKRL